MRPALPLLLLGALAGCATTASVTLDQETRLTTTAGTFLLDYSRADAGTTGTLVKALHVASGELERWGGLTTPVTIRVLPSREALTREIGREGWGWLTAWARYDTVFLHSPRTWSLLPPRQQDVDRVLLHELTHTLLYQRSGNAETWGGRLGIPLWFDEGMASYTAQQAYRWPGLEELARWYEQHPERDPLRPDRELYETQNHLVYGAGHHAFTFLVRRYGEASIRELMAQMSGGLRFDEAFAAAVGLPRPNFEQEFRRYVILRGFKRLRRLPGQPRPTPEKPRGPLQLPPSSAPAAAAPP